MEEMIEVHGKMVPKHIPQVHPENSEEYWTKYFPMCYKHKKDIYVKMQVKIQKGKNGINKAFRRWY